MNKAPLKGVLHSYSFRIALLYLLLFLVSTLILFIFIFYTSTRSVTEQLDETIKADQDAFAERFSQFGLNSLIRLVNSRAQSQGTDSAYSLVSEQQEIIAGNLAEWPTGMIPFGPVEFTIRWNENDASPHTVYRGEVLGLPGGYTLLIARSMLPVAHAQQKLINTFTWAAIITLLLGLVGGYLLSKRAMRRIASINRLCHTITEGDISQRLAVPAHARDDLDDLSLSINAMLDKIEHLMAEIVQVSDNIAHDLRTPLSHLRLQLETIQAQAESSPATRSQLGDTIEAADAIIDTFNALLRISKIQAGNRHTQFETLDMQTLFEDVVEFYEPVAEEKKQTVEIALPGGTRLLGDRDLLFQALSNLLDNAIKYTPREGHIHLRFISDAGHNSLSVCDNGPGVPDAELKHLTRRFYRIDSSRTQPGNGLGLSLVEAVANLHKARLSFTRNQPSGLCVTIEFP